jgi:hypothetical protein
MLVVLAIFWLYTMPFAGGVWFFVNGITALMDYHEEFDSVRKKHSAILDIILGTVLLVAFNGFFWIIFYPFFVTMSGLNLPTW